MWDRRTIVRRKVFTMKTRLLIALCAAAMAVPALVPAEAATTAALCPSAFTLNATYSNGFVGPTSGDYDWWVFSATDVVYTLTPLTTTGDLALEVMNSTCTAQYCSANATAADGSEQCRATGVGPHYIKVSLVNSPGSAVKYRLDPYQIA
jgi:hypothetical protein